MSDKILLYLAKNGPSSSSELSAKLGVSQPTISRLISANPSIIKVGGSKNTIYAAPRDIRQLADSSIPVFSIDENGDASKFGVLSSVHPEGFLWSGVSGKWPVSMTSNFYFNSLPYFIHDSKPQGFMGRNFAKINSDILGVSDNPERWSDNDTIAAIALMGDDLSGDLIAGEASYRRFINKKHIIINDNEVNESYYELARQSILSGVAGSSAGGEFPKFTAIKRSESDIHHVIVKFSGEGNSSAERRWSDLLKCESHAASAIAQHIGIRSANSRAFDFNGRTFLEIVRFDRVGLNGRTSMCSLAAIDAEIVGMGDPAWDKFADKLIQLKVIDELTASNMRKAWYFGKLIGNSDMHAGNLSFKLEGNGKLSLCPIYDMLPMRYAPLRGGEVPEFQRPEMYAPMPGHEDEFNISRIAALEFWNVIICDELISDDMKFIAKDWVALLNLSKKYHYK